MKKLLLVEDDLILGETLEELLVEEGYGVMWVQDGEMALDATYVQNFDLLLLDVNIPFINGFELLKELRESGESVPAIFITAKVDIGSLREGFDVGADDYLKKPFDFDELLIRIEALIKKSFHTHSRELRYGDLVYAIDQEQLYDRDTPVHLTPTELKLVRYFLKNRGRVIGTEELLSSIHEDFEGKIEVLRVQIHKLKKIGFKIINVRSVGYRLEPI
jgi:DNA-binding response OmpR family regulator